MYYRGILTLEENERNFVIELALNINSARVEGQTIPNRKLLSITKELIKKHNVDFEQLIYILRTDYNATFWYDNDFDNIFSEEMFDDLESVLFGTHKQLLEEIERSFENENI